MENEKKTGYVIYDFMKEDLDLSGVALRVYALIYSFTNAGGDCHASLNNMAKRVGASSRSVQRALIELTARGYVIKKTSNQASSNHYIADLNMVGQNVQGVGQNVQGVGQNVQGGRTKCLGGMTKCPTIIKIIIKLITLIILIHSFKERSREEKINRLCL